MGTKPRRITVWLRLRFGLEAAALRFAALLIPCLPRATVVALANLLGWLAWRFDRRDRRVAMANLDLAFGQTYSDSEKKSIVRQAFQTFLLTALDYFWFSRRTRSRVERHLAMDDSVRPWLGGGRPFIAVTGHFGNWEVFAHAAILNGTVLSSVAKPIKNPRVDAIINRIREQSGQRIIPQEGALKALVRCLRDREAVALLLDQDTPVSQGGVFVDFFGVPAPIASAAAGLAKRMGVPIVMVYCRNERDGSYRCYTREVLDPETMAQLSSTEITARITAYLEAEIRRDPSQWLWTYKRWKRRAADVDASRYPFYSR